MLMEKRGLRTADVQWPEVEVDLLINGRDFVTRYSLSPPSV